MMSNPHLNVEVQSGGSAFETSDDARDEFVRILRSIADRIERRLPPQFTELSVHDGNGNRVGVYSYSLSSEDF